MLFKHKQDITRLSQHCSAVVLKTSSCCRMTSKPKPTKASHYVNGILKALGALLSTEAALRLCAATRSDIAKVCLLLSGDW